MDIRRHDLHSKTISEEMPISNCRSIHDVFDLTKAFDRRDRFWKTMFSCPPRFISVVRQFHAGILTHVQNVEYLNGDFSEPFR